MLDGNYVVASGHSRPWKKQFNIMAAYLDFYNPLRFLVALVRPKSSLYLADVGMQAIGMWGLTKTVRRTLGWAFRLMRGNIKRETDVADEQAMLAKLHRSADDVNKMTADARPKVSDALSAARDTARKIHQYTEEDIAMALLEMDNGALAHFCASFAADDHAADPWTVVVKAIGTAGSTRYSYRDWVEIKPGIVHSQTYTAYQASIKSPIFSSSNGASVACWKRDRRHPASW